MSLSIEKQQQLYDTTQPQERDFAVNPYSPDEARVAKFLSGLGVGGGADPIGFILSSFVYMRDRLRAQPSPREVALRTVAIALYQTEMDWDDAEVMRIWRECGLPEYFLGNGGTNHKLVAFATRLRAQPSPRGKWKPGDPRCDQCDNGLEPDWKRCPFCDDSPREVALEKALREMLADYLTRPKSEFNNGWIDALNHVVGLLRLSLLSHAQKGEPR